jgi:hypothetical protein
MTENTTNLKEQLSNWNMSLDDFYIRIIIYAYEKLVEDTKKYYKHRHRFQKHIVKEAIRNKNIKITKQTLYNLIRGEHKTLDINAELILAVINEIRLEHKQDDLSYEQLGIQIYKGKGS